MRGNKTAEAVDAQVTGWSNSWKAESLVRSAMRLHGELHKIATLAIDNTAASSMTWPGADEALSQATNPAGP